MAPSHMPLVGARRRCLAQGALRGEGVDVDVSARADVGREVGRRRRIIHPDDPVSRVYSCTVVPLEQIAARANDGACAATRRMGRSGLRQTERERLSTFDMLRPLRLAPGWPCEISRCSPLSFSWLKSPVGNGSRSQTAENFRATVSVRASWSQSRNEACVSGGDDGGDGGNGKRGIRMCCVVGAGCAPAFCES